MKIICPHCQSEKEPPVGTAGMLRCPDCGQWFPEIKALAESPIEKTEPVLMVPRVPTKIARLHERGDDFCKVAAAVLVLAVLLFGVGLIKCLNQQPYLTEFVLAGALVSVSVWLYLIGQIIHIRANTEK